MRPLHAIGALLLFAIACSTNTVVDAPRSSPSAESVITATAATVARTPTSTPITADTFLHTELQPGSTGTAAEPTAPPSNPFLRIVNRYPLPGAIEIPVQTTIQFDLFRDLPVVHASISPGIALERIEFDPDERSIKVNSWDEMVQASREQFHGVYHLYRPSSLLSPNTTYKVSIELETANAETMVHTWQFTTRGDPGADLTGTVDLAIVPPSIGGNATGTINELSIEGRCIYIGTGTNRVYPVFENGTTWWEGDLLFLRGNRFAIGEPIFLGGSVNTFARDLDYIQQPDETCSLDRILINAQ